jgi:phage-related protein
MSSSIYNIEGWDSNRNYKPHDIVSHAGHYWYMSYTYLLNCESCVPTETSDYWKGMVRTSHSTLFPKFLWTPSYDSSVRLEPRTRTQQYGGRGVEQRIKDGLNDKLITLDLKFDKRGIDESTAILHFLHARKGVSPFLFAVPAPFDTPEVEDVASGADYAPPRVFVCKSWSSSYNFYNDYTVSASFEEKANFYIK